MDWQLALALAIGVLMVLFALGNILSALAPNYHGMLLFRFLAGLPHGAYFGVATGILMVRDPETGRFEPATDAVPGRGSSRARASAAHQGLDRSAPTPEA